MYISYTGGWRYLGYTMLDVVLYFYTMQVLLNFVAIVTISATGLLHGIGYLTIKGTGNSHMIETNFL